MDIRDVRWPGWEVVEEIGSGSYGKVYKIRRTLVNIVEYAALKIITIPRSATEIDDLIDEGYERSSVTEHYKKQKDDIVREYELMASLKGCPNIVHAEDISIIQQANYVGWDIYIKMELLTPLKKTARNMQENDIIKMGMDICNALMVCKKNNVIHRDIKPANLFVSDTGVYKLGDFGVAKTAAKTQRGTYAGTEQFMAPEVSLGKEYGTSVDIYSLGLVMYWLLNNRRFPFVPQGIVPVSEEELAKKRRLSGEALPDPVNGSRELKNIVLKACAFDSRARFGSAEEMYYALVGLNGVAAAPRAESVKVDERFVDFADGFTVGTFGASTDKSDATVGGSTLRGTPPVQESTVREEPVKQSFVKKEEPKQETPKRKPAVSVQSMDEARNKSKVIPKPLVARTRKTTKKKSVGKKIVKIILGVALAAFTVLVILKQSEKSKLEDYMATQSGDNYYSIERVMLNDEPVTLEGDYSIDNYSGVYDYHSQDKTYEAYNYLGVNTTEKIYSMITHIENGLYAVTEVSDNINSTGLLNLEGDLLIPTEAGKIKKLNNTERYLAVSYAQETTTEEYKAVLKDENNISYSGYIRLYDIVEKKFLDNIPEIKKMSDVEACGDSVLIKTDAGWSLYDSSGQLLLEFATGYVSCGNGIFVHSYDTDDDGGTNRYDVYDSNSTLTYSEEEYSIFPIGKYLQANKDEETVLLDSSGNVLNSDGFDFYGAYDSHYIDAYNKNRCGLLDLTGQEVLPDIFKYISHDTEYGFAGTTFSEYFFGPEGILVEVKDSDYSDSSLLVREGKAFVINEQNFSLEVGDNYRLYGEGMVMVKAETTGLYGLYDIFTGQELLSSNYDYIDVSGDYVYAKKDDSYELYKVLLNR